MDILLTGGTGLLGRALCAALLAEGHCLTVLSRRPAKVSALCGAGVQSLSSLDDWHPERHFDAVINLAGEPIVDVPWTGARKQRLWDSRVVLTDQLVTAIERAERKPAVLLSGSAVGIYGDSGEAVCSDAMANPCASDFGACLCAAWEAAARKTELFGVRVCLLRTGLVLARHGGLLARLRLPFSLGLGGRLGNGKQWMSWIHIEDWVGAVRLLLGTETASGSYNLTAPHPVRNAEFTATLAAALHRPAYFAIPGFALRMLLGQRAYLLLGGQCVPPEHMQAVGFVFQYPALSDALISV